MLPLEGCEYEVKAMRALVDKPVRSPLSVPFVKIKNWAAEIC